MQISNIIREAHSIAVDKGWHERPVRGPDGTVDVDRLGSLLLLIHTEIGEAWECFQNQLYAQELLNEKPEGMIVELADVVVRVCDLAGALGATQPGEWIGDYNDVELSQLTSESESTDQEAFNAMRSIVDQAVESMRIGVNGNTNVLLGELGVLLAECQRMAAYHELDLTEAVRVKMAFNRTRPYRHGGKAI
jgi:NTP pyrophosphatase (non-canonical NTP hydrolase)